MVSLTANVPHDRGLDLIRIGDVFFGEFFEHLLRHFASQKRDGTDVVFEREYVCRRRRNKCAHQTIEEWWV